MILVPSFVPGYPIDHCRVLNAVRKVTAVTVADVIAGCLLEMIPLSVQQYFDLSKMREKAG